MLELPVFCRMNIPGIQTGNWQWHMLPGALTRELSAKLLEYTKIFRRI